jgi:hypothetical protein
MRLRGADGLVFSFARRGFAAHAVWFFFAFALASAFCRRASSVAPVLLPLRWHPRYDLPLHALPLCGAAPTFLCRRKEK